MRLVIAVADRDSLVTGARIICSSPKTTVVATTLPSLSRFMDAFGV